MKKLMILTMVLGFSLTGFAGENSSYSEGGDCSGRSGDAQQATVVKDQTQDVTKE